MEPNNSIVIGILLSPKDQVHLSINLLKERFSHRKDIQFAQIHRNQPLANQGRFDLVIHKASDFIRACKAGDVSAQRFIESLTNYNLFYPSVIFLDPLSTVLDLADRSKMLAIMEKCTFELNGIRVVVPRWAPLTQQQDIENLKNSNFRYPLLCKALCAAEGQGCHDMQLIFHKGQFDSLKVFPSIVQEFINHGGILYKLSGLGKNYYLSTRPSVRDFPTNGIPIEKTETITYHSHDVAKFTSCSFLNNYRLNFVYKSTVNGDKVMDETVAEALLCRLSEVLEINLVGIDILISDNGRCYNLVDVNYLPSYDGIPQSADDVFHLVDEIVRRRAYFQYWKKPRT